MNLLAFMTALIASVSGIIELISIFMGLAEKFSNPII